MRRLANLTYYPGQTLTLAAIATATIAVCWVIRSAEMRVRAVQQPALGSVGIDTETICAARKIARALTYGNG